MTNKICEYCGKPIEGQAPQCKYHHDCAVLADKEKKRADYHARKKLKSPSGICQYCGKPIDNPKPRQKYHLECANIVHNNNIKRYQAEKRYYVSAKEKERAKKKKARSGPLSLGEISVLMKKYGYNGNYGDFVRDYHGKIKGV